MKGLEVIKTHTGKIYVDHEKQLEFLTVGDYGKENNIKADFLGLTKEIYGVKHKEVDLTKKWVATISTQHGCLMNCRFCDCPSYGYNGDVALNDLSYQIKTIIDNENVNHTDRFNVHFARMGEPTFNPAVLFFTEWYLRDLVLNRISAKTIHPVISTMLPVNNADLKYYLKIWTGIKNSLYEGEAGLQFSINSTDDDQRNWQFNNMSLPLNEISKIADSLPMPVGRKYTLNFAVTKDTILDAKVLTKLFDKDKFIVKLTPIHKTHNAVDNNFDVSTTYYDYDVYRDFEQPLLDLGWDVITFIPSIEEDSDRITCGNALISRGCANNIQPYFKR